MVSFTFDTFYSTVKVDPAGELTDKTLVVVNAPNPFLFLGLPPLRYYWGQSIPSKIRLLVPGYNPLKITRTGEKTLLIETQAGSLMKTYPPEKDLKPNFVHFYHELSSLFRPEDLPFKAGEKTELSDMSAEVISVDTDGQPTAVRIDFDISLDDPSLCWQQWNWKKSGFGSYRTFEIPSIGETIYTTGAFGET